MIVIEDIWSAIDKGYERLADLQYEIAKKSVVSGEKTDLTNKKQFISLKLLAYLQSLEMLSIDHTPETNRIIERIYNNIKNITKNITLWD